MDVGKNTTLGNGYSSQKLVQLLIVTDGELKMAGVDPLLLVVTGSVAGQLKDLSGEVLHHGSQVDRGASTNTLRVVAVLEETVNATNRELKSCASRSALSLSTGLASFASSRHDE